MKIVTDLMPFDSSPQSNKDSVNPAGAAQEPTQASGICLCKSKCKSDT